jgi:hypothetical protein
VYLREDDYQPLRYSFVSLEGFLDARLLTEILRRMDGDFDRKRLKTVVEALHGFDLGLESPVSFGPGRHQGSDQVYYTTVQDGRFVRIDDWEGWRK